jgi:anaerobic selenocysteine-containing dehydrogenase
MSAKRHKSTCPYCGLGCGLMVAVKQGKAKEFLAGGVFLRQAVQRG